MDETEGFAFAGVLDELFDRGLKIFDKVIDFELAEEELKLAERVSLFKSAQAAETRRGRRRRNRGGGGGGGGRGFEVPNLSTTMILLLGVGGLGLILLLKR